MALKTTRRELKNKFRKEIAELKNAVKLECFLCTGYQGDGYEICEITDCPLYEYRLRHHMSHESVQLRTKAKDLQTRIQGLEQD